MKEKRFKKIVKNFDPTYPKKPSLKNLTSPEWSIPSANPATEFLGTAHVESFNFATGPGLEMMIQDLEPVEFLVNDQRLSIDIVDAEFRPPEAPEGALGIRCPLVYPGEARQRGTTYKACAIIKVRITLNGVLQPWILERSLGYLPIMVKSKICNLSNIVTQGISRERRTSVRKKIYPIAMCRPSWKNRGKHFSEYGVLLECSKPDLTVTKNVLHFVTTGSAKYMFSFGRQLFFVPVIMILKCLTERTDADIYAHLIAGTSEDDHYYRSCLKEMLTEPHAEGLFSPEQIRLYIGKSFKDKLKDALPEWTEDEDICKYLIKYSICIHAKDNEDKFQTIVFMIKKLFALVQNRCVVEGVDSVMMQEVTIAKSENNFEVNALSISNAINKMSPIAQSFESFLSTGNIPNASSLGLMQNSGISIMAENINRMRYMSHFRAIHRGSFFQEMRTTEVRALLPDAWGFICPVHTPDGSPCGLLNHFTLNTEVITHAPDASKVPEVLYDLGVVSVDEGIQGGNGKSVTPSYSVFLNGILMGYVNGTSQTKEIADKLRILKVRKERGVPRVMEIVLIPYDDDSKLQGQYPGLFLFTGPARMMRPVINLAADDVEFIGTFEQVFLNICIQPEEAYPGVTTHRELRPTTFLSNLASLIPLPDFNQSPRNMYQCQMGKQTMATPIHTWHSNSETKIYRLQTPTSPFFRPVHYDYIKLDEFPMGTNAIVAVISYTGYDMEDAMIINKSSFERGFCSGSIYKAQFIDLKEISADADGLPYPGVPLFNGDPLYCYRSRIDDSYVLKKYEGNELAFVDSVKILSNDLGTGELTRVSICYRIPRNASVGDKFASRAGQKVRRMTIAMMVECMAEDRNNDAIDFFGKQLESAGYNYYGTETMYSGTDGVEMKAEIFFGVIHYQRLRHMVSDKFQVRSQGAIDQVTRQPIKGRRRGGGVRFGEMERDALLSHGSMFLLQDRLFHGSDKTRVQIFVLAAVPYFHLASLYPKKYGHLEGLLSQGRSLV
ncbi:DNA-directed RNA polymerase I subunit RPA2 [Lepeophtheirus salmonis]|uniref:DNA-directed RNA polymerase n=1 Tax=Lepeophtheirus salmonis TaxID=72036 RepID=A0A7R8CL33_LEPSM|nr:DNA-directed RNA polymerase I subunit RPA2 [Lepeophtheirus salmonis]CAF2809907.1 DNA-directed RNA polymerase I subunit RPA2 [Lepeophtheirus salmonis]